MKIGTIVEMAMNSDLTNFGVSRTNSIAPPPVHIFNIEMVIIHKPLILGKSPWKCIQFFPKLAQMLFGLSCTEITDTFFLFIFVQKLWGCEWQSRPKIGSEALISAKLWSIETKLGMLHQHHDLRVHAKVGNRAPYESWDNKNSHICL